MSATGPAVPSNGMLERLLRANEDQARSAGALVEIQRDNNTRLEHIEDESRQQTVVLGKLVDRLEKMDDAREEAVKLVKEHTSAAVASAFKDTAADVKTTLGESERWWRRTIWVIGGLVALSQLLGVGIKEAIELLK